MSYRINHLHSPSHPASSLERRQQPADSANPLQALQQGNTEGAKIYASNAIRKKNESLNLLRLSSRIDAVSSRVETAVTMRQVRPVSFRVRARGTRGELIRGRCR